MVLSYLNRIAFSYGPDAYVVQNVGRNGLVGHVFTLKYTY